MSKLSNGITGTVKMYLSNHEKAMGDTEEISKNSVLPGTVEDGVLCTSMHLLLQKKSNMPSLFLFSTMSDS